MQRIRCAVLILAALVLSAPASAEVCYSPQGRGLSISRYQLDTITAPYSAHRMDASADPWAVGRSDSLDFTNPAVFDAHERRYGLGTACTGGLAATARCGGRSFKRWAGPGNEVRSLVADALAWWSTTAPQSLGGPPTCRGNGVPSEREITDAQAVNDGQIWNEWHRRVQPGGTEERPIETCRSNKPRGPFTEVSLFWGWTDHYLNTCGTPAPAAPTSPPSATCPPVQACPSPPPSPPACASPPADVLAAARRAVALSTAKAAGAKALAWLEAEVKRCSGSK